MFGIGQGEFLVILLLAVIFIGPRRLPAVARWLARAYQVILAWKAEFDRQLAEIRRDVETAVEVELTPGPEPTGDEAASVAARRDGGSAYAATAQVDATPSYSYRQEMLPGIEDGEGEDG